MDEIHITEEDIDLLDSNPLPETINNFNRQSLEADLEVDFTINFLPFIFYHNSENVEFLENSNKIILPKRILYQLSQYNNIVYPLYFKINNSANLFSVHEFLEDIDHVYISRDLFHELRMEYDMPYTLTLFNQELVKGTKIRLQPHNQDMYEIENIKEYLEENLTKLYTCLMKDQTLSIPYDHTNIYFNVVNCEPEDLISIIDTDIEVDFAKPLDYVEPKPVKKEFKKDNLNFSQTNENNIHDLNSQQNTNNEQNQNNRQNINPQQNTGFIPFSGVGHRLGD